MSRYLVIRPNEDGNPLNFIDKSELGNITQFMEDYGIDKWTESYSDPNYWDEGAAMLLKFSCVNPVVKKVIETWELPS